MPTSETIRGKIKVSLIGSIRSHLRGLLGYDTMILELMQNADDAKAEEMVFDIRDESLRVQNSAEFIYCGDLEEDECTNDKKCDFHGIIEFAGGHKELDSENIGRFGIGFSSVYQITDRPTIISNGISIELIPEIAEYKRNTLKTKNTTIEFPWATNPDSKLRKELGLSNINQENIEKLFEVCESEFNQSLLFLRHLNRIELKRNGKSSLIVKLDRKEISDKHNKLSISFEPENRAAEEWLVFDNKCPDEKATKLKNKYEPLAREKRKSEIQIAVKTDSISIGRGLLYAYLPTQQSSYLPLHINADFYPDPNRKSINLQGGQHQQKWNELLIAEAAEIIANELDTMTEYINHKHLFRLFVASYNAEKNHDFPFTAFWDCIEKSVKDGVKVFYSSKDEYEKFDDIVFDQNLDERKKIELSAFYEAGGKLLNEDYFPNQSNFSTTTVLIELGVKKLTINKFGDIVNTSELLNSYRPYGNKTPTDNEIKEIFMPLWSYANALISSQKPDESNVKPIDFALTSFDKMTSIGDLYRAPTSIKNSKLGKLLQLESDGENFYGVKLAHDKLSEFDALYDFVKPFSLYTLVSYLEERVEANDPIFSTKTPPEEVKKIYELIVELYEDYDNYDDDSILEDLKLLPIWKTSTKDFSDLGQILLPGNFDDPIGDGQTLDSKCLSPKVEKFIKEKLEVDRQTIEAYIKTYIPQYFSDEGWTGDTKTYQKLMLTFANHKKTIGR